MTKASCILCGNMKFGAFTKCKKCNFVPQTTWEFASSNISSDNYIEEKSLCELSKETNYKYENDIDEIVKFGGDSDILIEKMYSDPSYRDIFTISKPAKNSFFKKRMNFQFDGTDGYHVEIVTRGEEVPKEAFDILVKEYDGDAFFIETYEEGKKISSQVSKDKWYCFKDMYNYVGRNDSVKTKRQEALFKKGVFSLSAYMFNKYGFEITNIIFGDA